MRYGSVHCSIKLAKVHHVMSIPLHSYPYKSKILGGGGWEWNHEGNHEWLCVHACMWVRVYLLKFHFFYFYFVYWVVALYTHNWAQFMWYLRHMYCMCMHTHIHSSSRMLAMQLLCRLVVSGHPYPWLCCMCLLLVLLLFCCCFVLFFSLFVCLQVLLVVLRLEQSLLFGSCRCSSWLSGLSLFSPIVSFYFLPVSFSLLSLSLFPCQVRHYYM